MSWMKYDITFCVVECGNTKCYRNPSKMPESERRYPHSYAMFKDTEDCEGYKDPKEKKLLRKIESKVKGQGR